MRSRSRLPAAVAATRAARRSSGSTGRASRPASDSWAVMRESIVGLMPSSSASSDRPSGPSRTTVNSTEICDGVSPEPAQRARRRRESLPIAGPQAGRVLELLLLLALRPRRRCAGRGAVTVISGLRLS